MTLDAYRPLGRSGLLVSRLALGTMTFGQPDWGCTGDVAEQLLDMYLQAGGNVIDTADVYGDGASEEMLGRIIAARGVRDRLVLSTKFTFATRTGDPNAGGNGRKAMMRALEGSLRRLGTDHVDVYIVHAWDARTPVEEVMRGLDDLVSAGKVRYVALSDVPAWYAARAQSIAQWRAYEPLCALQQEYSLIERGVEYEFPALCAELGMDLMIWGPLAEGLLSGKYVDDGRAAGRVTVLSPRTPRAWRKQNEHSMRIVAEVGAVATALDRTPAQVAVNWVANRPAVGTVLLGATRPEQLRDTLAALDFSLPDDLRARLDGVSTPPRVMPYALLPMLQRRLSGTK